MKCCVGFHHINQLASYELSLKIQVFLAYYRIQIKRGRDHYLSILAEKKKKLSDDKYLTGLIEPLMLKTWHGIKTVATTL